MEENWRGRGLMKPMLDLAFDWCRDKSVSVITLGVLHRNWIGTAAWHKFGFEEWNEERRLELKPRSP